MSLRIALSHVFAWPEVRRGGERYLHHVASGLKAAGHEVTIFTTATRAKRDVIDGVPVVYLRRREPWRGRLRVQSPEMAFAAQLLPRLAARSIDVWHALGTADAAAAAALGRLRSVTSVYTDLGITAKSWRDQRPDRRLYDFAVAHLDRYICLSEAAARSVRADYGRTVSVLGGGVDMNAFAPAEARNPKPALLYTSDVTEPRKNFSLLLEALAILLRRRPDVELWVAGPGDPEPALASATPAVRAAVVRLGVVPLDDLPDLYARAWATVLPSSGEAFGIVVVESFAAGTPAVTLDDAGPAELVGPGTGETSSPTAEALASACERALDLAADPATAARCRAAAAPHDWRSGVVPTLEGIYCGT